MSEFEHYVKHIGDYTFFYKGHLSQWYGSFRGQEWNGFYYHLKYFNCAEQFMMYQKAKLFNDNASVVKILDTQSAKEQQKLGRQVKNYNQEVWNRAKFNIVYMGNLLKFSQNEHLRLFLKSCRPNLVEASPVDKIWGIGHGMVDINKDNYLPFLNDGENLLGKALTKVRGVL